MNVLWRFLFRLRFESLKDIHEIIPAFIITMVVYLLVSKMSAKRQPTKEHLD